MQRWSEEGQVPRRLGRATELEVAKYSRLQGKSRRGDGGIVGHGIAGDILKQKRHVIIIWQLQFVAFHFFKKPNFMKTVAA